MITRLLFLGPTRLYDSVVTLSMDHMLSPRPDRTIVHCKLPPNMSAHDLRRLWRKYGIDTSTFPIIEDDQFLYPLRGYNLPDRYGRWIGQQLIKFVALNNCDSDKILIQDCDTALLRPYTYFDNSTPIYKVGTNETHSAEYYSYIETFLQIPRQTSDCFVTEYLPVLKADWVALRDRMEELHKRPWLDVFIKQFDKDFKELPIWFSEYELLGNWCKYLFNYPSVPAHARQLVNTNEIPLIKTKQFALDKSADMLCFKLDISGPVIQEEDLPYLIALVRGDAK